MTDAVVDRLEVVEVEDDQREAALVALRAGDLAGERLVEVPPVVHVRQRVEIRECPRLGIAPRVLERRAGPECEPLELVDLAVRELPVRGAGEGREGADRQAVGAHGKDYPGADDRRRGVDVVDSVAVGDLDRPQVVVLRHVDRGAGRLLGGDPDRRVQPAALGAPGVDHRRLDPGHGGRRLQGALRHLVQVERGGELPDEAVGPRGVLGGVDRIGQIPHGFVHSRGHPGDGVRNLGVGRRTYAPD